MESNNKLVSFILTIVIHSAVIGGAIWATNYFYLDSGRADLEFNQSKLSQLKQQNDETELLRASLPELERSITDLEATLYKLNKLIPAERDLPVVFDWISSQAVQRRVRLEHFEHNNVTAQNGALKEYVTTIDVFGNFFSIARLIEDFSRFERILRVSRVAMRQEQEQPGAEGTLHAQITFSAYLSAPAQAVPATSPAQPAVSQ